METWMLAKIGAKFYLNFGPIETKLRSNFGWPELILIWSNILVLFSFNFCFDSWFNSHF